MTNSINSVSGYGNGYPVGGYSQNNNAEESKKDVTAQAQPQNYEETQVDPSKVMDFLANNNYFIAPTANTTSVAEVDPATEERIAGYMENFEMIYGIIVEEFGEANAPMVMDYVMDYLMGMAA